MTINKRSLNLGQWYTNAPKVEQTEEVEQVQKSEVATTEEVDSKTEEQIQKAFESLETKEAEAKELSDIEKAFSSLDSIEKEVLEKSEEEDELEKSEGGRGGKVIGHTKSGKPIYQGKDVRKDNNYLEYQNQTSSYNADDHRDAHAAHSKLAKEHLDKYDNEFSSNASKNEYSKSAHHARVAKHLHESFMANKSENDELEKSEEFTNIMKSFESGQLKNSERQTVDSKEEALQIALKKSDLQGAIGVTNSGKIVMDDLTKSEDFNREEHLEAALLFKSQMTRTQNSIQVADLVKKSNFHQQYADIKLGRK